MHVRAVRKLDVEYAVKYAGEYIYTYCRWH
jgi:hypothetical protein